METNYCTDSHSKFVVSTTTTTTTHDTCVGCSTKRREVTFWL